MSDDEELPPVFLNTSGGDGFVLEMPSAAEVAAQREVEAVRQQQCERAVMEEGSTASSESHESVEDFVLEAGVQTITLGPSKARSLTGLLEHMNTAEYRLLTKMLQSSENTQTRIFESIVELVACEENTWDREESVEVTCVLAAGVLAAPLSLRLMIHHTLRTLIEKQSASNLAHVIEALLTLPVDALLDISETLRGVGCNCSLVVERMTLEALQRITSTISEKENLWDCVINAVPHLSAEKCALLIQAVGAAFLCGIGPQDEKRRALLLALSRQPRKQDLITLQNSVKATKLQLFFGDIQ